LYLGVPGVLHPSESLYQLIHARSPWDDGHAKYQSVPVLEAALQPWPEVQVVVTSPLPSALGLASVLPHLGPTLAERVVGCTFEDLTSKVRRAVVARNGSTRAKGFSTEDYWRMSKAQIVAAHVAWRRPVQWVVVDEEDILWPAQIRQDQVVLTDGCLGLKDPAVQDRLHEVLLRNFGTE
jgi:hypothetical protein